MRTPITYPLRVTFDQKVPLGRILRNFRLHMCTHKGTQKGSLDLRSLPVAMVPVLLYYYPSKKKNRTKLGMRRTYFRLWRHFRSWPLPVMWLPAALPHRSTTNVAWSVLIYYCLRIILCLDDGWVRKSRKIIRDSKFEIRDSISEFRNSRFEIQ
jgi:hypothetical protein